MIDRDATDRFRFSPIQTDFAKNVCARYGMPSDVTTAVLIDEEGGHTNSSSILRMFPHMGFPYDFLGPVLLLIPRFVRDFGYRTFAKNRGAIWIFVKRVTGMGDTKLDSYRGRILGLKEPIDRGWGFEEN